METKKRLDLVDREAVKDAIGFMNLHFLGHGETKSVLDSINEVPAVDAVEVVRCRDCRFYNKDTVSCSFVTTDTNWYEDDFCSYGERKDNG